MEDVRDRNLLINSQQRKVDEGNDEYENRIKSGLPPRNLKNVVNARSMKNLENRGASNSGAPYKNNLSSVLSKNVRAS